MHPAENYQLKFQQHGIHLNSAIATLYRNEKFADVVLFSSNSTSIGSSSGGASLDNGMPAVGISAHKFILSACSQFFAAMFETAPIATPNGVYYVVLPPELSYRAIQILVQYIYTGEATVPNDVLNEVLRGGEILKIRGLYRAPLQHEVNNNSNNASNSNGNGYNTRIPHLLAQTSTMPQPPAPQTLSQASVSTQLSSQSSNDIYVGSNGNRSLTNNNAASTRYAIEYAHSNSHPHPSLQYSQSHLRSLGTSVLPKDSPVIVKSPKLSQLPLLTTRSHQLHHNSHHQQKHRPNSGGGVSGGGSISVNKEFGIDPEVKCCYQPAQHDSLPSTSAMAATSNSASLCTEMGCTSCGLLDQDNNISRERDCERERERHLSQSEEMVTRCAGGGVEHMDREYVERPILSLSHDHERDESSIDYNHHIRSGNERSAREYFIQETGNYEHPHSSIASVTSTKPYVLESSSEVAGSKGLQSPPSSYSHTFLAIKQEPADWTVTQTAASHENNSEALNRPISPSNLSLGSPKQPLDFKMPLGGASIKLEVQSSHSTDEDEPPPPPLAPQPPVQALLQNTSHLITNSTEAEYNNEVSRRRYEVSTSKQWLNRSKIHSVSTVNNPPSSSVVVTASSSSSSTISSNGNGLTKSYVPKKKRRVSQQENTMDHVPLQCDICSTIFDTPAEWVRHMNNQHTEVELAMFNSRKEHEKNENTSASVSVCPAPSNYQLNHHHQPQQNHHNHHHQHHHHHHNNNNKKYSSSSRSTLSAAHNNLPMHNSTSNASTKRNPNQTITATGNIASSTTVAVNNSNNINNNNNNIIDNNTNNSSNIIENINVRGAISPGARNLEETEATLSPLPS